jgi:hypothetical protein
MHQQQKQAFPLSRSKQIEAGDSGQLGSKLPKQGVRHQTRSLSAKKCLLAFTDNDNKANKNVNRSERKERKEMKNSL